MVRRIALVLGVAMISAGWGCQNGTPTPEAVFPAPGPAAKAEPILPKSVPLPDILLTRPRTSGNVGILPLLLAEQDVFRATNEHRERQGLALLRANPTLAEVARTHAGRMARARQTGYELEGKSISKEVDAASSEQTCGLALGRLFNSSGSAIIESILKDPTAREQLLNPPYREVGIGMARDPAGYYYYVVVFQAPRR